MEHNSVIPDGPTQTLGYIVFIFIGWCSCFENKKEQTIS